MAWRDWTSPGAARYKPTRGPPHRDTLSAKAWKPQAGRSGSKDGRLHQPLCPVSSRSPDRLRGGMCPGDPLLPSHGADRQLACSSPPWVWPRPGRLLGHVPGSLRGLLKAVNHQRGVQSSPTWGQASEVCHMGKPRPGDLPVSISAGSSIKRTSRAPRESCGL